MKTKRIWAWLLALTMVMSFVPNFGGLVYAADEPTVIQSNTKENTNQAGGIIYTKTSTAKSDGTVDITLTAHTTGEVRQMTSVSPTDIVLVIDASGSMSDNYQTTSTTHNAVTGSEYTYTTGSWPRQQVHTAYGFERTSTARYINTGTQAEPVYTRVTYTGRDANGFDMYEYALGNQAVIVYPVLSGTVSAQRENAYSVVQFYTITTTTQRINKMTSLRNAVNAFIDTTARMNEGLETEDMHTISIVKFAGPHYSNNTTDTPTIVEGNGTYTLSNGNDSDTSNYTQVVKGLTAVDTAGADALKTAASQITPAGSTAVDKGLALAEAVLMDRSQVVTEGAVDRNEVVIVFTDGEPNHWNGYDQNVANSAISVANRMKGTAGVTIYSVCIDTDANATDISQNINKFMHYISSNYPSAESMDSDASGCDTSLGYYMTPDESTSLSMVFDSIIQNIDRPTVTLGEEAAIVDTISPYFDFEGGVEAVKLQTSERIPDGNGGFTWATPVNDSSLEAVITDDRLTVNGFDFDTNFVSETGRGTNGDFYGKQLVVSFTVVPDYGVIDVASATLMGNVLPTNSGVAALVDSNSVPQAEVTTPTLSAYQVTYTIDDEDVEEEDKVYNRFAGSEVIVNQAPEKEGYEFDGWTMNGEPIEVGDMFTMPNADVEIIGSYTPVTRNVIYKYADEGSLPPGAPALPTSHTAQFGDTVDVANPLELTGYVFKGWKPLNTDVVIADDGTFTMPAHDVTLEGYFESSTSTPYRVEHYLETLTEGVYETEPIEVETDFKGTTGHTVKAIPLNRFTGFEYNPEKSKDTIEDVIAADGSLVLKVYYDRIEYTVTYSYEGDTQIDDLPDAPLDRTYKYDETVTVADPVTPPAGYTFTGWYRGTADNPVSGTFKMPAYDVHMLGFFTANSSTQYTVKHYLMDTEGEYPRTPETIETFGGKTDTEVEAKPLTTFEGFEYDPSISTVEGTIAGDGSLELELYYARQMFDVIYDYGTAPEGATGLPDTDSYYHGETVDIEEDATAPGYTFSGWQVRGSDVTVANGSFVMPIRNVNVTGHFTANNDTPYKVKHFVEKVDGSGYESTPYRVDDEEGTTDTEVTAVPIVIEGFTYNDAESASTKTGIIEGDGSLVLELYYDRNDWQVTYEYEGNVPAGAPEKPTAETYFFGEEVEVADPVSEDDTPDGYTFVGWYRGTADNPVSGTFDMPNRNVVLRGYFKPDNSTPYTVKHYLMDTDGEYPLTPERTETLEGTTDDEVEAKPLTIFEGFEYDPSISTVEGTIAGDGSLELELYYARQMFDVIYDYGTAPAGASNLPDTDSYYHGETVDIEEDATAPGYTFSGWQVRGSDVTVANGSFKMPIRDVNVTGHFTANNDTPYKVKHFVEKVDGSGYDPTPYRIDDEEGTTDTEVTAVPIVIEGFTYNDAESASTKTGVIEGDGSLELELYYDRNDWQVTYEYEGNVPAGAPDEPTAGTYFFGEEVDVADPVSEDDTPDGYTFVGWYRGEVTNIVESFDMPNRNVVLRGYFKPNENTPYVIYHYLETLTDGVYETDPVLIEDQLSGTTGHTVKATPLNRFTGFTYNPTKSEATIEGQIKGDGSLVLRVYYDRNEHTVTYGYEGDQPDGVPNAPGDENYVYGEEVTVAGVVTPPTGYTFVGWYRGTSDNPVSGTFDMPNYSVHILGHFVANTDTPYTIKHYLEKADGSGYDLDDSEVRLGETDTQVSARNKEYPGFEYQPSLSTTRGTIEGDGSLVLEFYYNRNLHDVTYEYEGVTPAGTPDLPDAHEDVRFGETVEVEDTPHIPGYTFIGWYDGADNNIVESFDMPDHDVVLKGKFQSNIVDYTVNYWLQNINDDDYTLEETYDDQAYVGQLVQAREYTFTGFSLRPDSNWQDYVTANEYGDGNLVLNLYFDRHTYNVTYGYYGEQPDGAPDLSGKNLTNVRYGKVLDVEEKPEMAGYSFNGWYTRTATVTENKFTMPDHDVTFLGLFVTQYTVDYDLNDGTGATGVDYSTQVVDAGEEIAVKDAPTRSGYTFTGWKEAANKFNPGDTVTVDRNIIFVAQWSRNGGGGGGVTNYTLTYETNGGNDIAKETYNSGATVKLTKVPLKEGYVFEGWYLDEALTENVTEVKMTKDITVYASWVEDNGGAGNGHKTPDILNGDDHFAYVVGYPDGTVQPEANILRSETAAIFFRLLKPEVRDANLSNENAFADISADDWFNSSVSTLVKLGIVAGKTENTFDPNAFITRAEFAAICARFDNSEFEVIDTFTDVSGHWAEDEIHEAAAHGWIKGYEDKTFRPDQYITRAEAMSMINRVLNRIPEKTDDLIDDMVKWPDNSNESTWYYLTVQEATNSHDYEMKNNVYETWTAIREVVDWAKYNK